MVEFVARSFLENCKKIFLFHMVILFIEKNLETVLNTMGDIVVMVDDGWLDLWSARKEFYK